ncbi:MULTISPECIES: S9 family peptidase [Olivibacter]|jgi:dipeptidyl-peptidase-4|uniref:S9 family peptidase n=1 Tax=Olivibacter oleidegradans TaxID=760123 RepID=A0ABV6HDY4_9SPHI|nr:S9 family peptidase [Olivibacter jilunii]MCL4642269.1 S9 family peptidase [Olivibacter sp. UJ_SKK_5.1]
MRHVNHLLWICFIVSNLFSINFLFAQPGVKTQWTPDGNGYYEISDGQVLEVKLLDPNHPAVFLDGSALTPQDSSAPLKVKQFSISADRRKVLLFTNTKRVWRYHTRGDYWIYDINKKELKQLGKGLPASSLMFAKLSPDGTSVAYVSKHNVYIEDLASNHISQLTEDGTDRIINGTFDWAYEEEFGCRDGFRWSSDGKHIAYWKIDARSIRNYLMLNTTDSTYSFTIPVEYPKAGQNPSACFIYVVDVKTKENKKMDIPGDPVQHYIPRMEWTPDGQSLILQQLDRKQQESHIMLCSIEDGKTKTIYTEQDQAWIDIKSRWNDDDPTGWEWIDDGKAFLWVSEKDGWRHIYKIDMTGKEALLTKGDYDVIGIDLIDQRNEKIYFSASPANATQKYLYQISIKGGKATQLSPTDQAGTHSYRISPNGKLAEHEFSSSTTYFTGEIVSLPNHQERLAATVRRSLPQGTPKPEFFKVTTIDGIEMDGWMVKPSQFDSTKRYPVVFYVYGEPAGQTVTDTYGAGFNRLYEGSMADDGYIYISVENRGAPAPKGRDWRKAIYRNIGAINIRDQAMAAKEILKWNFVDSSRVAVWGWSGGGSSTLNLLFQYPEIYKTGIAVAAVGNQLMYDNIYQERYMGVPPESQADYVKGSPITHAKNLRGNLLYIHGTGDDNVHYQNAEMLINELVKHNKQFQLMSYPNRSHSISEGEGTSAHLSRLYTNYLKQYCPPGGR